MKALNIPVEISQPSTGMAQALLSELAEHLQHFIDTRQPHTIDINSLPLSEPDIVELEQILGVGEVKVTLTTIGESEIFETAFSGIWWVKHFTPEHILISQFIEITDIPDIIKSQPEDIRLAISRLPANLKPSQNLTKN